MNKFESQSKFEEWANTFETVKGTLCSMKNEMDQLLDNIMLHVFKELRWNGVFEDMCIRYSPPTFVREEVRHYLVDNTTTWVNVEFVENLGSEQDCMDIDIPVELFSMTNEELKDVRKPMLERKAEVVARNKATKQAEREKKQRAEYERLKKIYGDCD